MSHQVFAQASPISIGGKSLFTPDPITSKNVRQFYSAPQVVKAAIKKLQLAGFKVHPEGNTSIGISGPVDVFEKAFHVSLQKVENKKHQSYWINITGKIKGFINTQGTHFDDVLEGIALTIPSEYYEYPYPPQVNYWHLRLPGDVSLALNADKAHRKSVTGKGVRVTLHDSGFYQHPYYQGRGYRYRGLIIPPNSINYPKRDRIGHGTGIAANLFAISPDCELSMAVKFVDPVLEFNHAANMDPKPDVISCSWGYEVSGAILEPYQQTLAAAVADAVSRNIIVVFAAGNGHHAFPGQHPDVISVGGAYITQQNTLEASSYASSFESLVYTGRKVPDVCGLVGEAPRGVYLMLPAPPNSLEDEEFSDNPWVMNDAYPEIDNTATDDGWIVASGTSSAAPQIAGICALMREKDPDITPQAAKQQLMNSAVDVKTGNSSEGTGSETASEGIDLATGAGLADAWNAVRTMDPVLEPNTN